METFKKWDAMCGTLVRLVKHIQNQPRSSIFIREQAGLFVIKNRLGFLGFEGI